MKLTKLALVLLLLPVLSFGQENSTNPDAIIGNGDGSFWTAKPTMCNTTEKAYNALSEFHESIIFQADNNTSPGMKIVLTENKETGTWTLMEVSKDFVCILGAGTVTES